jgi:hypothetical protein
MYSVHDTACAVGCPIRTSMDQSLLAAPHGFSQRATSFIASWCQGIHRMPFSRSNQITKPKSHYLRHHAQKPSSAEKAKDHSQHIIIRTHCKYTTCKPQRHHTLHTRRLSHASEPTRPAADPYRRLYIGNRLSVRHATKPCRVMSPIELSGAPRDAPEPYSQFQRTHPDPLRQDPNPRHASPIPHIGGDR